MSCTLHLCLGQDIEIDPLSESIANFDQCVDLGASAAAHGSTQS